jgi:diadenosine tetraphosphate (Ap4A) HIT family hydrolase
MDDCPFCAPDRELLLETTRFVAFADAYPVTAGHTLVCPRRHAAHIFELDDGEWVELWDAVRRVQGLLAARLTADGWNVGANSGAAAGQTVPHAHVHVIPRRRGDVADPRGGVRAVIADRAAYWQQD